MSKYIGFDSGGFHFLLGVDEVVEVFDAMASPEPVSAVLVGNAGDVYWRGQLARMLHLGTLLDLQGQQESCCYVICRNAATAGTLYILNVDAIHALHDMDEKQFQPLKIGNARLNAITDTLYINRQTDAIVLVLRDIARLFDSNTFPCIQ